MDIKVKEGICVLKAGLIVNPIAGMGGKVGLKGTDGEMYEKALEMGAEPISPGRIEDVLDLVKRRDLYFFCGPGSMGEDYLAKREFGFETVGEARDETSRDDTIKIAKRIMEKGADVLIFVGGDGTARDILDAVGMNVPVIAIPSGVKMFSSVFVFSPHAAAEMIDCCGDDFTEKEVLDIDEEAFRGNRLDAKYYGTVRVPNIQRLLQGKKAASNVKHSSKGKKKEVAKYVVDNMNKDCLYILGPGTTVKEVADALGVKKTLLGIDSVCNSESIGLDIGEKEILRLIDAYKKVKIIVTPIGGNGFIFGRGSRQISSEVLRKVGKENIIIISTLDKVGGMGSLHIDSGDYEVDRDIGGNIDVLTGYKEEIIMEVKY